MNTLAQIYEGYQSPASFGDKGTVHSYIPVYEQLLAPYRRPGVVVAEIGILTGMSLRMWEAYFQDGTVYGLDLNDHPLDMCDLRPMIAEGTHHIVLMDAANPDQLRDNFGGVTFDVVIEDASHSLSQQLDIYRNWKAKMNPGGIYIIEDVEDIVAYRSQFEMIDPEKHVTIFDRRHVKGRFDDVLVVIEDRP